MKKWLYFIAGCMLLTSCLVKKKTTYASDPTVTVAGTKQDHENTPISPPKKTDKKIVKRIINSALQYKNTPYRYGGTSKKGMDCSGLIYTAFTQNAVSLPRVSRQMAKKGRNIKLSKVTKGDLLFFKTAKKGGSINHVGLVVAVNTTDIKFIHATTSRGVIVSSLSEGYWSRAFVKATRVL